MYCPECGCKIEDDNALFCPECGAMIREEQQLNPEASERIYDGLVGILVTSLLKEGAKVLLSGGMKLFSDKRNEEEQETHERENEIMYGIILTNVRILATKLNTTEQLIRNILERFIEQKRQFGVVYQLVDAGNYTYFKSGFWGKSKKVHLDSGSGLWEYMDILMDIHQHEIDRSLPESNYLFIIGGDDIIPVAKIRHYLADDVKFKDKDIETDILYGYPYGREMIECLENQKLFCYEQLFYVGRLPMGVDTSVDDFSGYLDRDIACSKGIPMQEAYIQSDPNWKRMTATAAKKLLEGRWLKNLDGYLVDGCYFNGLILSPLATSANIHEVFDMNASVFFFNLHGSNAEGVKGYFGEHSSMQPNKSFISAILPEHLGTCRNPNLMYSGACYGANYIGKDKNHSMVLSSIYSNSLLFVGSSRMAFGGKEAIDAGQLYVPISFGDVLARGFWDSIMEGNVVGKAFFDGRRAAFKAQPGHPIYATTIVEFNMFGDPTLRLDVSRNKEEGREAIVEAVGRIADTEDYGCMMEEVKMSADSSSLSILEQVRQKVNDNVYQIHQMVGRHLYTTFGIEPRPANSIFKQKYADGTEVLSFNYDVDDNPELPVRYIVETTEQGEILNMITTK